MTSHQKVRIRAQSLSEQQASIVSFPLEIYERIIDLSKDSQATLHACSLTCRAWLPRSRHNIFPKVTLNSSTTFRRYLDILRVSPTIARYAHTLRICSSNESNNGDWYWAALVPLSLSRKLTNLQELEFICPLLRLHPSFVTLFSQFTRVSTLSISGPIYTTLRDFVRLVVSLPLLSNLRINLDGITFPEDNVWVTPSLTRYLIRPKLTSLMARDVDGHLTALITWLLDTPSVDTLQTLWFEFYSQDDLHAISRLISACTVLHDLTLDYCSGGSLSGDTIKSLSFASNSYLQNICLPHISVDSLPALGTALSSLIPQIIRTISLRVTATSFENLISGPWNMIDHLLSSSDQFSQLYSVSLFLDSRGKIPKSLKSTVSTQLLPVLDARGVLDVSSADTFFPFKCMIRW